MRLSSDEIEQMIMAAEDDEEIQRMSTNRHTVTSHRKRNLDGYICIILLPFLPSLVSFLFVHVLQCIKNDHDD
jgi:hypothetical protein